MRKYFFKNLAARKERYQFKGTLAIIYKILPFYKFQGIWIENTIFFSTIMDVFVQMNEQLELTEGGEAI